MAQIIAAIVSGVVVNVLAALIIGMIKNSGRKQYMKSYWMLFIVLFLIGGVVGFYAYPQLVSTPVLCENLGTSEELTSSAWKALEKGNYACTLECTQICIDRHSQEAKDQQGILTQQGAFATGDNIPKYWALNDVSTCWFIRGELYRKMRENENARQAYQEILNNYSYGQCWDPRGWYWKLADGAREKLTILAR